MDQPPDWYSTTPTLIRLACGDSAQRFYRVDSLCRRQCAAQNLRDELVVAIVKIVSEVQQSVLDVRRTVSDVYRNLVRHLHRSVVGWALHRRLYLRCIPAKYPLSEIRRLLYSNASVTERADVLVEQLVIWRVVEVDIEVVLEKEFH